MGLAPNVFNKTVATAGTKVQISVNPLYVQAVFFEPLEANTGSIYIGNSTVSSASYMKRLAAGSSGFSLNAAPGANTGVDGGMIELSQIWIDASTAAQVVCITYLQHIGRY